MKELVITDPNQVMLISSFIFDHFEHDTKPLKVSIKNGSKRSLNQNAFQHVIYKKISDYLISKGREEWTPEFTKKNLKNKFLGWEDEEYVDIHTGEKLVKSVLRSTASLDKGDSFNFTTAILDWSESIGCQIAIPTNSEYMDMVIEQNS